ncbi:hypothetical protein K493DRAFT_97753 [Basidiobolus meristosporus CBS 931.73]|uniref:Microtubule associated protein n=1 Tax=Basidiobolus meristosporus CBS 931.73 TaxID=1314790 RepID=A0A1Y1YU28_9FUNG|nr:hypothetical protein K493DRAFT_97753 [Basidiobolus meristosporus CBS 931.73]|eukprot:ORY01075.1 hypothetical protein K493DRAFT_97753 [Basidiobolus meristosporus CBS 931.73]
MELFHSRIHHLHTLWSDLGYYSTKSVDSNSSIPTWAEEKFQPALRELDRLVSDEAKQHAMLKAEVEDLEMAVEEKCSSLGRNVDLYLPQKTSISSRSLYTNYLELKTLCNRLDDELTQQKQVFDKAMLTLRRLTKELFEMEKLPSPSPNDLSPSTVDFVRYAARDITELKEVRVQEFNSAATDMHQVWQSIKFTPSDDIEQALVDRFTGLDEKYSNVAAGLDPIKLEWYLPHRPPLTLSGECVEMMKQKQLQYNGILAERKERRAVLLKKIARLYKDLETPEFKHKEFKDGYEDDALAEIENEHDRLRETLMVNLDQLIDDYKLRLTDFWEKCEISQDVRNVVLLRIMEGVDKEERADIIREELIQLEDLYDKCHPIFSAMKERRELIQKMIDFEKTASDPRRLFRSSFQLNQEEKWRKTAYPNLLSFEEQLINAILNYELEENKPFIHNNERYMDVLEQEIAERPVNLTVFGFGNGTPVKPRTVSYSGTPTRGTPVHRPTSPSRPAVTPRRPASRTTVRSVSRTSNIEERRSSVSSNDSGDSVHTPLQMPNPIDFSQRPTLASSSTNGPHTPRTRLKSGNASTLPRYRKLSSPPPPLPSTPVRTPSHTDRRTIRKPAVATLFGDTINSPAPPTTPTLSRTGTPRTRKTSLLTRD